MISISRLLYVGLLITVFFSCKSSKNEKKPLTAKEFLALYKKLDLPINVVDSGLAAFGDTTTIDYATFTQFVPDSAVQRVLETQAANYKINTVGILHTKTIDYLLTKFTSDKIIKLVVFVLDDKHHYISALQLINNQQKDKYIYSLSVTTEPTFIIRKDKLTKDNTNLYSRTGFAYNETLKNFSAVMNDSNEGLGKAGIINPIDTFAAVNKWSGDYITDSTNFISVRDGKNTNKYLFFVHFEKQKGSCVGELKGEMTLTDAANAVYQESGDPCVIRFKFSAKNIVIKEDGNCGNYRGITCPFDFTFKKKKPAKTKS